MSNAIRSIALQSGIWWVPGSHTEPPKTKPRTKTQQSIELADTIRGGMLDRFERIVYDDGPVAAMLSDLEEHLDGSGWTGQEIIDLLREGFFPELMQPMPDYQQRLSLVPRRGGGGASIERMKAFLESIAPKADPNKAGKPDSQASGND